jgi:hypothetical protein
MKEHLMIQKTDFDTLKSINIPDTLLMTIVNLITYVLTPWSRVILEKLTGFHLVKKFPEFYGIRRFITADTNAHHLHLY